MAVNTKSEASSAGGAVRPCGVPVAVRHQQVEASPSAVLFECRVPKLWDTIQLRCACGSKTPASSG
eukprot:597563-Prorocentrum_minimum.AAC.1